MFCTFSRRFHSVTYHCPKFQQNRNSHVGWISLMFYGLFQGSPARYKCLFEKLISLKNAFFVDAVTCYIPQLSRGIEKVCAVFVKIFRRCKATGSMLDTVDACSLLCRLEMEGRNRANQLISTVCMKTRREYNMTRIIQSVC